MIARWTAPHFKAERETADERRARKLALRAERAADPNGQQAEKRKADRAELRHRLTVKRKVWRRSSVCEFCAATEAETALVSPGREHVMHEVIYRSKTRGLEPEERFSTAICARSCTPCHEALHAHRLALHFYDLTKLMLGDYDVVNPQTGQIVRAMRRPSHRSPSADALTDV